MALTGFFSRSGHPRAGSYDALSPRYDRRPQLFSDCRQLSPGGAEAPFEWMARECRAVQALLDEAGLSRIAPTGVRAYARTAIAGREHTKSVFTRWLSDALESLADWAALTGLDRAELPMLRLDAVAERLRVPILRDSRAHFSDLVKQAREERERSLSIKLVELIVNTGDLYVVPLHRSAPHFVTGTRVEARVVRVGGTTPAGTPIWDFVVCVESGDPGFDWVFTRGIAGFISTFGGANIHMAIRCAEFGLPAAIGCGEHLFERALASGGVELDCGGQVVRPVVVG